MSCTIRRAAPGDAAAAATVHWRSWRDTYRGLLADALLDGLTVEMRAAQWRDWLAQGRDGLFVAEEAGRIVGAARVMRADGTAAQGAASEIDLLHVATAAQGRGCGAALLRACAGWAAATHPGAIGLWVIAGNERAARFYARLGARRGLPRVDRLNGHAFRETAWMWDDADAVLRAAR